MLLAMTLGLAAAVSDGIHARLALRRAIPARRFEEWFGSGPADGGPRLTAPIRPDAG